MLSRKAFQNGRSDTIYIFINKFAFDSSVGSQ